MHINTRLRQARIGRNWRQWELAEQLGTTVDSVKRWERGRQQPSAYFRFKLCTLFGKGEEELGLIDAIPSSLMEEDASATEQANVSAAEPLGLWTVPYRRNPHFTGREGLLEQLTQHLSLENPSEETHLCQAVLSQPQAIKGLGGIGKTQIAVEYAYRSREQGRYTHILWINAGSEEAIITSFLTLAALLPNVAGKDEKDQRKLITAILHWLQECQEPWLLIVDNADDLALVQPYLPGQGQGSILLTTRAHAVGWLANALEVEQMGLMEGTHFLLHRAQCLNASDEDYNEATNLVIALDGFPLALDQAGAYMEETGCSFGDYLQLYEQHRATLLARRGKQASNYPASVATTWSLSFQQIERANPAAADLLRLCAYLSPDQIPEELLKEGAPHWPSLLQEAVTDLLAFNQMLSDLLKFSLIKRLVEKHMLSIHRLVQVVQRERMDSQEQEHWATRVVSAVNVVFPADPKEEIATWPQCQRYLEQVQACDLLIQQYGFWFSEAADVLNRAGIYLCEQALYALAEPLFQRALGIWERQLGPGHFQVAEVLDGLADLYRLQSKYAEAELFFLRALRIREQQWGPDHPKVVSSLSGVAFLYFQLGKYAEAEPLFLRALHICKQQWGPDHPKVADHLNNLANLYVNEGRHAQGESFYQRAIRICEQQWGLEHPKVAYPLNNLAILYYYQGKYVEAEPLFLRTLRIREQQLGPEHPKVAYPLNNLGELYVELGKYAEAEPLLQQALHIREQHLGPEHPDVAYPLTNLANLYVKQGKYAEAEPLYQRALRIWEQALGSEHPQMVDGLLGLANLYCQQERYQQAEPLYQHALSIRERYAEVSYATAEVMHDFAVFQEVQGHKEDARIWYERAFTICEQVLGPHHPKTKETHTRFIALLHAMGQQQDASPA